MTSTISPTAARIRILLLTLSVAWRSALALGYCSRMRRRSHCRLPESKGARNKALQLNDLDVSSPSRESATASCRCRYMTYELMGAKTVENIREPISKLTIHSLLFSKDNNKNL